MNDVDRLIAIEDIKRVKAHYCRAIDEKKLEEWRDVFCADAVALTSHAEGGQIVGVDALIEMTRSVLEGAVTVHHIHAPEIDILSDDEAVGIWAMEDRIYWPVERPNFFGAKRQFRGTGFYREKYRRIAAGWRIAQIQLMRQVLERDGEPVIAG